MARIAPLNPGLQTGESARLERHIGTPATARAAAARPEAQDAQPPQPGTPRLAQSSIKSMFRSGKLVQLPAAVVDKVASLLTSNDVSSLSQTDKTTHRDVKARMGGIHANRAASRANTLGEFRQSIVQISNTRSDLRAEPLRQLLSRTNALPETDRPTALREFNNAIGGMASTPLPWREKILEHPTPQDAVMAGEQVQLCASCFDITSDVAVNGLERLALGREGPDSIKSDVDNGASVQQVANKRGIVTQAGVRQVEQLVISSQSPHSARRAIEAGAMPREVAQRFGINRQHLIPILMEYSMRSRHPDSAGGAVARGVSVQAVVARFGIDDPDVTWELSRVASQVNRPT